MKNSITQHLKNKSFFLIGIGGVGMMGIAELLHNMGFSVRGSDIKINTAITRLRERKIKIFIGHDPKNIKTSDIVVHSNAISKNNVELKHSIKSGLTVLARMEILAELMRLKYGISITGSHGKTTTTSLLSHIMYSNNLDPTYLIGGKLKTDDPHVNLGKSHYLVTETDESDPTFSLLQPHLVVLTNLDKEHLENYNNNYTSLERSVLKHINSIPFYGKVFLNGDDKNSNKLFKHINREIFSYGFTKNNDLRAKSIMYTNTYMMFDVHYDNHVYPVQTNLFGKHNIYNILAAVSVAIHLGINTRKALKSLETFYGVSRRFDIYDNLNIKNSKPTIIDDYGHHPTEIESTIKTIKEIYPKRKIVMVFQPHRYSRTKLHWKLFSEILSSLNVVLLLPTYSAGEKNNSYDSEYLFKKIRNRNKFYVKSIKNIIPELKKLNLENCVVVLQGAGDIREILNLIKANADI